MQKIYSMPRDFILSTVAELTTKHEFKTKDLSWKATIVEEEFVSFEVGAEMKKLLAIGMSLSQKAGEEKKMSINPEGEVWKVDVQANGAESYYFSRVLFVALARIKSGVVDMESLNLEVIKRHTLTALLKVTGNDPFGLVIEPKFKDGRYKVTVPANGMLLTFESEDVDLLCRWIGNQLRGSITSRRK